VRAAVKPGAPETAATYSRRISGGKRVRPRWGLRQVKATLDGAALRVIESVHVTPVPSLLAILVCDSVIVDSQSKKPSVVGIFDSINATQAPFSQRLGFFARMTDAEGEYKFTVRVVYLGDEEQIVAGLETETVPVQNRLQVLNLALNLPPVPFPNFGRYEFQLLANDVYIGRAVISALKLEVK